eukprot:4904830-Pleurochrysis_carterae.AAC.2
MSHEVHRKQKARKGGTDRDACTPRTRMCHELRHQGRTDRHLELRRVRTLRLFSRAMFKYYVARWQALRLE